MALLAEEIENGERGWVVWFRGTSGDGWEQCYPFNKHNGSHPAFKVWADANGVAGYVVEPDHVRFRDEADAFLAYLAFKG